jgi:PKD repeat protein
MAKCWILASTAATMLCGRHGPWSAWKLAIVSPRRARQGAVAIVLAMALLAAVASSASAVIVHLGNGRTLSYQPLRGAATPSGAIRPFDKAFKNLDYNGGPVMGSNTNYTVYWRPSTGPAYPSGYQAGVNRYLTDLAHDSGGQKNVDSVSTQYNDVSGEFANYNSRFGGALIDENPYPANGCAQAPICLTDEQLRAELTEFVKARGLPIDLAHEYFLLTPPGVEDCFEANGFECSAGSNEPMYCAFHGNIPVGGSQLIYSNDPYVTGNPKCDDEKNHPNGSTSDGVLQGGLSHEHIESITDPEPNNAWTDFATGMSTGFEIGDKCGGNEGVPLGKAANGANYNQVINGHFYWYQQEWSNQTKQCLQRLTFSGAEPTATFTSAAAAGNEMAFDATGSTAPGGVAQYSWQFNDGSGPVQSAPVETTTPTVSHVFPKAGQFGVALTVFAANGTSIGTARRIVTSDEGPTAASSVTTASPTVGQPVAFDGSGSSDPDGSINSYSWNFGDGSPAGAGAKPSHTYAAVGPYIATVTVTDSTEQTASVSRTVALAKGSQAITFTSPAPSPASVGGPTYTVAAKGGGSGEPVTFTIDPTTNTKCSIAGSVVSFTGAGTCRIDANQAGNANYNAAPQEQQTVEVGKGAQAITFTSSPPSLASVGGPTYTPTATGGGSGLGVTFTIDATTSTACSISGSVVSFSALGTCTIDANQAGDANYNPAPQAQQSFVVGAQTITFTSSPPSPATVGGASYIVAAAASSGLPVSFTSGAPAVCSVSGSTVSFVAAGMCTIVANQGGDSTHAPAPPVQQSFIVEGLRPLITPIPNSNFSSPSPTVNAQTGAITFTASVGDPGRFSWLLTFQNGKFGVFAASRTKCRKGLVRLNGRCRPSRIVFARGSKTVPAAGSVIFIVRPSSSAMKALRNALKQKRGLPVAASLTFQSARGGAPVSHTQWLTVRLKKRK